MEIDLKEREGDLALKALASKLQLTQTQQQDTDPERGLNQVAQLLALEGGRLVCLLEACPEGAGTRLYWLEQGGELQPIAGLKEVEGVWPSGADLVVLQEGVLYRVDLHGQRYRLLEIPEGTGEVDLCWRAGGVQAVAIVRGVREEGPVLFPRERDRDELQAYDPATGWRAVAEIPSGCSSLSLAADGTRCAWSESVNTVPEEAMRGEFRACNLATGQVVELTAGAGQAGQVRMAPDASGVVYQANFSLQRPITTHTDLWWQPWDGEPQKLTAGDRYIDDFGWLAADTLWVSYVDGTGRTTARLGLDGAATTLPLAATGQVVEVAARLVYQSGDQQRFPYLAWGERALEIPQPDDFTDLQVQLVDWTATDGLALCGVIYECASTPALAPLLVRAHGGPAGTVEAQRGEAVRHRHLLRAGYRVFEPAFRGSLGFGDDFLGANIGCQGEADLDDIITGIDKLAEMGLADAERVGIFGGSYGGYMTLQALAASDRFRTGVALYGFIDNRWMTLETGDFTYEDEYIAPVSWPMEQAAANSDVFSQLHQINCPLLLLHGDQDPICTLSQSKVVYRALEHRGIDTGLVVYPGEGHGFRQLEHQRDCARRTLLWFEEHLPV
ncbi:MAG: prolyl oligopeptidase family serine peptidase [Candidatus Latescibacteria bacterium]|nr:prolyl oligopeptidase family serine peptidase [Candidatus Latescibacterota bacterium]